MNQRELFHLWVKHPYDMTLSDYYEEIRYIQQNFKGEQMIEKEHLDNWFKYHAPTTEQTVKYETIRKAAHNLASVILDSTPTSADQTAAIRKVREAVMTANAAIACEGQ